MALSISSLDGAEPRVTYTLIQPYLPKVVRRRRVTRTHPMCARDNTHLPPPPPHNETHNTFAAPQERPRKFKYPSDPVDAYTDLHADFSGKDKDEEEEKDEGEPLPVRFLRRLESRAAEHRMVEETLFHRTIKRRKSHPAMSLGE